MVGSNLGPDLSTLYRAISLTGLSNQPEGAQEREARVPIDREQFFALMASFASSVTVITSQGPDGVVRGLTASAFCSVSLDPRLCLVSVDNRSE